MRQLRTLIALAGLLAAMQALAFVGEMPGKTRPQPEMSQSQVAQQQKFNGAVEVVGSVPEDTEPNGDEEISDREGNDELAPATPEKDKASFQTASRASSNAPKLSGISWTAIVLGLIGLGVILGFRKVTENAPKPKNRK